MLRTMREKTKIIMLILAVAFVGWLVFDVGMGVTGRQSPTTRDLGSVDGSPIKYQEWLQTYQAMAEQERQRVPGQALTREDQKALEDGAFEQLVEARLLKEAYKRRGIVVTDEEIRDAARRFPPEEVTGARDFQTDGKFDPNKWQRFLASGTQPEFLLALEQRYRAELPRLKLLEAVRRYGPTAKMAFIVLTSNADKSVFQHAVQLGVNNYLMKPFTADSLRSSIEAVVGKLM